jgi:PIN domain nuclease of toxin-antitoxin system
MRLLLDTRVFLWWNSAAGANLSSRAERAIADPANDVLVSAATAWEIARQVERGTLELPEPAERWVPDRARRSGFAFLPVETAHALRAGTLPGAAGGDAIGRLLAAQAQMEGLVLVTADPAFGALGAETLW